MAVKRIGILTSGGDAPGMNAAVRAVVRTAASYGIECLGVRRGYNGLINGDITELSPTSVNGITNKGGTMLYTARCPEFHSDAGLEKAKNNCKLLGIEALVTIGGDGTFRGARDISHRGIPVFGIPATIDNDIGCTNYAIGFDTSCNTAVDCIDKLSDTMQSHERCSVVEVMGRNAGHLAVYVGIAAAANAILVPEREYNVERDLVEKIRRARINGRTHFIVIVAEGVCGAAEVAAQIREATSLEPRVTIIGHIQRGGSPSARDRVTASRMGRHAVEGLIEGKINRVVGILSGDMQDFDITDALNMKKDLQESMYETARILSMS